MESMSLLNLLAEIASQKLKDEPMLQDYNTPKEETVHCAKKPPACSGISNKGRRMSLSQVLSSSENSILRLFTSSHSNEMKRRFYITCHLLPEICHETFQSFASEEKAKRLMKKHLRDHLDDLLKDYSDLESQKNYTLYTIEKTPKSFSSKQDGKQSSLRKQASKKVKKGNLLQIPLTSGPKNYSSTNSSNISSKEHVKMNSSSTERSIDDKSSIHIVGNASISLIEDKKTGLTFSTIGKDLVSNYLLDENVTLNSSEQHFTSETMNYGIMNIEDVVNESSTDNHFNNNSLSYSCAADGSGCKAVSNVSVHNTSNVLPEYMLNHMSNQANGTSLNSSIGTSLLIPATIQSSFVYHKQSDRSQFVTSKASKHSFHQSQGSLTHQDDLKSIPLNTFQSDSCRPKSIHFKEQASAKLKNDSQILSNNSKKSLLSRQQNSRSNFGIFGGGNSRTTKFLEMSNAISQDVKPVISVDMISKIDEENLHVPKYIDDQCTGQPSNEIISHDHGYILGSTEQGQLKTDKETTKIIPKTESPSGLFNEDLDSDISYGEASSIAGKTYDKGPQKSTERRFVKGKGKFIGKSKDERKRALAIIEKLKYQPYPPMSKLECCICEPPRTFTAPSTLMSHYRSHAGIRPYVCNLCNAYFTRHHSLNYHLLIHSNKTRFTCDDCGRKFRHPSHFKEHRRKHTGESPFKCADCFLSFKTRNTYKRHLRTRHAKRLTPQGIVDISIEEAQMKKTKEIDHIDNNKVLKPQVSSPSTTMNNIGTYANKNKQCSRVVHHSKDVNSGEKDFSEKSLQINEMKDPKYVDNILNPHLCSSSKTTYGNEACTNKDIHGSRTVQHSKSSNVGKQEICKKSRNCEEKLCERNTYSSVGSNNLTGKRRGKGRSVKFDVGSQSIKSLKSSTAAKILVTSSTLRMPNTFSRYSKDDDQDLNTLNVNDKGAFDDVQVSRSIDLIPSDANCSNTFQLCFSPAKELPNSLNSLCGYSVKPIMNTHDSFYTLVSTTISSDLVSANVPSTLVSQNETISAPNFVHASVPSTLVSQNGTISAPNFVHANAIPESSVGSDAFVPLSAHSDIRDVPGTHNRGMLNSLVNASNTTGDYKPQMLTNNPFTIGVDDAVSSENLDCLLREVISLSSAVKNGKKHSEASFAKQQPLNLLTATGAGMKIQSFNPKVYTPSNAQISSFENSNRNVYVPMIHEPENLGNFVKDNNRQVLLVKYLNPNENFSNQDVGVSLVKDGGN